MSNKLPRKILSKQTNKQLTQMQVLQLLSFA